MESEELLQHLGGYGIWQLLIYMLHGCIWASMAIDSSIKPYKVDTPPYHCNIPANSSFNNTIPSTWENGELISYERCHEYINKSLSNETQQCSSGFYFDPQYGYESTITSDFELVCGKEIYIEVSMMTKTIVSGVGSVGINYLSDRYGRKTVYMIGIVSKPIFGIVEALMPNFALQYTLTVLSSLVTLCAFNNGLLLVMEMTPAKKRTAVSASMQIYWAFGLIATTPLLYFFRNWRTLQLVVSAPCIIFYAAFFTPESITWLQSKGKTAKVEKIVKQAAKCNEIKLPVDVLEQLKEPELQENHLSNNTTNNTTIKLQKKETSKCSILDMITSPTIRLYTIAQMAIWINIAFVYDALILTMTYLPGDRYLNFLFNGLAELVAAILLIFILMRFGRRLPLFVFHIIAGISLMLTIIEVFKEDLQFNWVPLVITFNIFGRIGISAVYMIMYLYTPEIYPTEIRGLALGVFDFVTYMALLVSPYSRVLERYKPGLFRGICGVLTVAAGFLGLLCPETHNRPLPETIEDVENMTKSLKVSRKERISTNSEEDTAIPLDAV